jgi:uncharacterized protein
MKTRIFTINSRKFNGEIHRSWNVELISKKDSLLSFVGVFDKEVFHSNLGVIRRGTVSYEYYWLDRWFNVFRFHEPEGNLRNFYCNLNMPPVLDTGVLDYIDLEIDVLVSKDFRVEILDLEEFEENSKIFGYSDELKNKIFQTLDELLNLIKTRSFPFSRF